MHNSSSLKYAVQHNRVTDVKKILSSITYSKPISPHVQDAYASVLDSPRSISVKMLRLFLQWGISPDVEYNSWEGPAYPVPVVTFKGEPKALKVLLEFGASLKGDIGCSALTNAISLYGHNKIRWNEACLSDEEWSFISRPPLVPGQFIINSQGQLLQEHARDTIAADTIANWLQNYWECFELLVAKVDLVTDCSYALHEAATFGWPEIVRNLISHGARKDTRDGLGKMPIDRADFSFEVSKQNGQKYRQLSFEETINLLRE